jgi:hypothetical protein
MTFTAMKSNSVSPIPFGAFLKKNEKGYWYIVSAHILKARYQTFT